MDLFIFLVQPQLRLEAIVDFQYLLLFPLSLYVSLRN